MFRSMRRSKQALSDEECVALLQSQPRGVLSVHGEDGYPYAFPMDYIYIDGKIYFHCAKTGHKIDAIDVDNRVSFCVMDEGYRTDGDWALNIKSVIIFGRIKKITDIKETEDITLQLGLKYYPTRQAAESVLIKALDRVQILELDIDHMTGKLVNES